MTDAADHPTHASGTKSRRVLHWRGYNEAYESQHGSLFIVDTVPYGSLM